MFDLSPLTDAPLAVQIHAIAALEAVVLTPLALLRRRRDRLHKIAGYLWVTNMVLAAASSFWITEIRLIGPFSPIHALSVLTLVNVVLAVRAIWRRNVTAHQAIMKATAFWGLGVAGLLALVPGRRMHAVLFGPDTPDRYSDAGLLSFVVMGVALAYIGFRLWSDRKAEAAG
ncbi:DUF2306 domain-containing protein [Maritimibacter sp. DP1N21-5]|uniref:DUF2306 domain-containing protein n=1 Tax=Maritimibacter sp. DP1N21-5 TaxID=2836867 RepID=UPI001C47D582|nr:DUF2306 domain-containing protein [Maritimibacter sp. DP1N21-5]MBV7410437.1 DUF2306 domain-containing protein [Maritimibacter sp. DP1N21-5]